MPDILAARPAAAAASSRSRSIAAGAIPRPVLSPHALWYGTPAGSWERQALPIGNARLGAMLFGNPDADRIQFNEQSLWGGLNDYDNALAGRPDSAYDTGVTGFGSYRDFGQVDVTFAAGNTVTAPGGPYETSAVQRFDKTFDGDTNSKWCIVTPPAEVVWQVELAAPTVVSGYTLTSAEDVPARDPQDWSVQGSSDGTTWTTLDSRTGPPFENRRQAKSFAFSNATAFSFYRFVFAPKVGVSHFQVSEIALDGVELGSSDATYVSSPSGHSDSLVGSVDRDAGTVWEVSDARGGAIWQLELTSKRALNGYTLTGADGAGPRDWTISGSTDGLTWNELDQRGGQKLTAGVATAFTFTNTTAFTQYRITFTASAEFQLSGVAFSGTGYKSADHPYVVDYRRALDIADGVHSTHFATARGTVLREAFASRGADVIVVRYTTDTPGALTADIRMVSKQDASTTADADARRLTFAGTMANDLSYAATLQVADTDGQVSASATGILVSGATAITLLLDARTDYLMDADKGWRGAAPASGIEKALTAASARSYDELRAAHVDSVAEMMSRASVDWGTTPDAVLALPMPTRLARYGGGESDPTLEQTLYAYGRYLLLSSSKPGGLPANLQGLWNNSNQPPWAADYHTNINIQMNYWAAETTNLPEAHEALTSFIEQVAVPSRVATRNAFGADVRGWTARTSQSIFGGNSWEWNTVASAWYAQHLYEHWAFTQDRKYLRDLAYPLIKEICWFWEDRLKELPDGTLVSPNGWSPEHGPREDGVMYDQQIIWDLFQNYLDCARALDVDEEYQATVADMQVRLAPNKIGRWGQLQEWQTDRDDPKNIHRHTSHLFAVYPGRQITTEDEDFAAAALVSLKARCGEKEGEPFTPATVTGDSRGSWTWPWRTAVFARLGDAERAAVMLRGLLTFNTFSNLWSYVGVYQIDGNLGISAAIAEMLLQSHDDAIRLLPAVPQEWGVRGSFTGLRARGGYSVSAEWRDGKVVSYDVVADRAPNMSNVVVVVNGQRRKVKPANPKAGKPMRDLGPAK
ncbi:glycoside hydrolase N-terminal domain-containing protein [Microbacterium sp. H1-D42]|uniref:glycosyl hydrolase family 95 catalytic domain-containing protein n=1 Tax=Microbacterium sp. H1-D42 TaxID=2925844 RepID=UPI001F52C55B|nr:glycoside hydrolase N-terminal domain-containing protein [Microbacterium sp. H1-D42]UNK70978.1 glycoside hydrolase N-terminal domain-containing protein [Microbacterium sp. H1-D42]